MNNYYPKRSTSILLEECLEMSQSKDLLLLARQESLHVYVSFLHPLAEALPCMTRAAVCRFWAQAKDSLIVLEVRSQLHLKVKQNNLPSPLKRKPSLGHPGPRKALTGPSSRETGFSLHFCSIWVVVKLTPLVARGQHAYGLAGPRH